MPRGSALRGSGTVVAVAISLPVSSGVWRPAAVGRDLELTWCTVLLSVPGAAHQQVRGMPWKLPTWKTENGV